MRTSIDFVWDRWPNLLYAQVLLHAGILAEHYLRLRHNAALL